MPNLPETTGATYPGVRQIENGETQAGGTDGLWNEHAKGMIERTNNLKSRLDAMPGPTATQAEAVAGIANDRTMTPLRVAQAAVLQTGNQTVAGQKDFSDRTRFSGGTAALPGIAWREDAGDTGIYRPAAQEVAIKTGPVRPMLATQTHIFIGPHSELEPSAANVPGITASIISGLFNLQSVGGAFGALYVGRPDNGQSVTFRRAGVNVGSISVTASATSYNTSSDYRLKQLEARPEGYDPAATVVALAAAQRWFSFISDPGSTQIGWYAHELAEIEPRAVYGAKDAVDDDDNIVAQGRDDSKLIPHLVAALAAALRRIDALEEVVGS